MLILVTEVIKDSLSRYHSIAAYYDLESNCSELLFHSGC